MTAGPVVIGPGGTGLAAGVCAADRAALARALTVLEDGGAPAAALLQAVRADGAAAARQALIVGVTGPPGVGKSVLTGQLIGQALQPGDRVGVLAIDPSSPLSGGALLADRVRMAGQADDDHVFIRSMASRGQPGGLAPAAGDAAELMELAGFQTVLIETVGVGQDAVGLAGYVDVLALVVMPGLGDELQAAKSGLAETADVIVVNKADLPGAPAAARQLRGMVALRGADRKRPPVLCTAATAGDGIPELWAAIGEIATRRSPGRAARRGEARAARAVDVALAELRAALLAGTAGPAGLLAQLAAGEAGATSLAAWLLAATAQEPAGQQASTHGRDSGDGAF